MMFGLRPITVIFLLSLDTTSKGDVLEYRVRSLVFEGQTVLGKDIKPEPESPDNDIIPKELLEQHNIKPQYEPVLDIGEDSP
ncbi:MAG: hypothetical protein IPG70_04505 [Moraxellaceae bacterium]|nr:hypothetical protein [Moraxellaceae bacterium]